jgi:6,7-dimethyl-8-ribityllumazine synthase|tara:strand:- start:1497 stop:1904 length:408 start_codon:yes stop_codon:yes gene_type:complete
MNIAILTAEYNKDLTKHMKEVAQAELSSLNAEVTQVAFVPGVLDMPLIAKKLLQKVDGLIVLGIVIKGDSDHDQVVANHSISKLKDIEIMTEKPIGFGIIGPGINLEKARERVESYAKHAAQTVVRQIKTIQDLK